MDQIKETLRQLGATPNYIGYHQAIVALTLALEDEDRMLAVMSKIYQETALRTGSTKSAVERNMRTLIRRIWEVNAEGLQDIAGYTMYTPPKVAEFIAILVNYLQRNQHI